MKLYVQLLSIPLFLFMVLPATAKKWRVNNALNVPSQVDFNELTDAVQSASVSAGDTIYVEGSSQEYEGGVQINKQLTIIGPGYFLDQGNVQPSSANRLPAVISGPGMTIGFGSDGSYITGLTIYLNVNATSVVFEKTSNVTFTRNRVGGDIGFINGQTADINYCENIIITRNLICADVFFGSNSTTNILWLTNNLIRGSVRININSPTSLVSNGMIMNNTMGGGSTITVTGSEIAYNYVGRIYPETDNISIHDNILDDDSSNNLLIVAADATNVIDPYDDSAISCSNDNWEFPIADQTATHGAYNGGDPYYSDNPVSPVNLPAWPVIYESTVQPCGDNSIQVQFKVRSNN